MVRTFLLRGLSAAILTTLVSACADSATTSPNDVGLATGAAETSFLVLGAGNAVPATLAADVARLGGSITSTAPEIGLAVVELTRGDARLALGKLRGVSDVAADVVLQWQDPSQQVEMVELSEAEVAAAVGAATPSPAGFGDAAAFRAIQWAPGAISAPAAWNAGQRGRGARVAILDGGIRHTHIDIAPGLDAAASRSFVPGQPYNADVGTFWHGTHVAGIVGARGIGTVGIAPEATLIGVKVLHNGSGAFSWVVNGIVYAATPTAAGGAGADILNMSLGAGYLRQGRDAAQLSNLLSRAVMYARQQGALVITAAGNSAVDLDRSANLVFFPGQAAGAVNVSALGPMGWAVPGATFDLDRPASYTNYGQSAITLAAPGGDFVLPGTQSCTKGPLTRACWVFDLVMAPCRGGGTSNGSYCWAAGTSMAAPAAAGVAALIVGKYGKMAPAQLEAILRASADDLGKPGNDDFYGRGRVNAARAVQ